MLSQIDAHDLTVYPKHITNYQQVNEFETYENTEFISKENHTRTMKGLSILKRLNRELGLNKIWVYSLNAAFMDDADSKKTTIRELNHQERVYNFMFDYAIVNPTKDDILWIEYFIMKYRFNKIDEPRSDKEWSMRMMLSQAYLGMYLDKRKIAYIRGIWS